MTKIEILKQLNDKVISVDEAASLLRGSRKLRGVVVSAKEVAAYQTFVQDGNFREFVRLSGAKGTTDAQALLGRCARNAHEKIDE